MIKAIVLLMYVCGAPYQAHVSDIEQQTHNFFLASPEGMEEFNQHMNDTYTSGKLQYHIVELSDVDPQLCVPIEGPF